MRLHALRPSQVSLNCHLSPFRVLGIGAPLIKGITLSTFLLPIPLSQADDTSFHLSSGLSFHLFPQFFRGTILRFACYIQGGCPLVLQYSAA